MLSDDPQIGRALGSEGQYRLIAVLGRGGMATVYRAEHRTAVWVRQTAIKVVDPRLTGEAGFLRRFRQEAAIIASLEHPHILPVYDFGETDGLVYLVMRLVEGGTLADDMRTAGQRPWDLDRVRTLAEQILPALEKAHANHVVHRDVKPSNILIERDSGWMFLSDFGIATMVGDSSATQTAGFIGTPAYAAPEQVLAQTLDCRADIYSFGIILFQLLTGHLPYAESSPMALAWKHVQGPLPPARTFTPDLHPELESILNRALARLPEERFQSADDLRQALSDAIDCAQRAVAADAPASVSKMSTASAPVFFKLGAVRYVVAALVVLAALGATAAYQLTNGATDARAPSPALPRQPTPILATVEAPPPTFMPFLAVSTPTVVAATTQSTGSPRVAPTAAAATSTPVSGPSTVVLQDDFSDPATSQLPQNSTDPKLRLSIESGEYRVHTLDPAAGNSLVRVPVLLANGSISVEARFEGDATDRLLILGCRVNDSANGSLDVTEGYFLLVLPGPANTPGTGSMQLVRRDGRTLAPLSQPRQVATNPGDRLNRLELSCIGDTISAYINDKPAGESRDNTYGAGLPALGIGVSGATVMTSDARFHNLEVTER